MASTLDNPRRRLTGALSRIAAKPGYEYCCMAVPARYPAGGSTLHSQQPRGASAMRVQERKRGSRTRILDPGTVLTNECEQRCLPQCATQHARSIRNRTPEKIFLRKYQLKIKRSNSYGTPQIHCEIDGVAGAAKQHTRSSSPRCLATVVISQNLYVRKTSKPVLLASNTMCNGAATCVSVLSAQMQNLKFCRIRLDHRKN